MSIADVAEGAQATETCRCSSHCSQGLWWDAVRGICAEFCRVCTDGEIVVAGNLRILREILLK